MFSFSLAHAARIQQLIFPSHAGRAMHETKNGLAALANINFVRVQMSGRNRGSDHSCGQSGFALYRKNARKPAADIKPAPQKGEEIICF